MSFIPEKKIHQLAALIGSLATIGTAIVVLGNMQWQARKDADVAMKELDVKYQALKDSLLVLRGEITTIKILSKNKGRVK